MKRKKKTKYLRDVGKSVENKRKRERKRTTRAKVNITTELVHIWVECLSQQSLDIKTGNNNYEDDKEEYAAKLERRKWKCYTYIYIYI